MKGTSLKPIARYLHNDNRHRPLSGCSTPPALPVSRSPLTVRESDSILPASVGTHRRENAVRRLSTAFIGLSLVLAAVSIGFAADDSPRAKATVITGLASMPLAFTENQGQWDEQVLFRANAGGATMWFTKNGAYYQFTRRIPRHSRESGNPVGVGQYPRGPDVCV